MVEKIIVNPLSVRGHGNVVSSKTVEDFTVYNSSLSYEDSFYTMEFTESAITLSLTVSSGTVSVGDTVTCTATVLDDGVAVPNVSVRFYDGNSVLGTVESDSNGEAELTLSTLSAGSHSIVASYGGQSSSAVSVTVNKLSTTISLSSNKASCYVDETYVLSGALSRGEGYSVYLYNGNTLVDTLTTGANGEFTKTVTPSGTGSFSYTVRYNGDSTYAEATSSAVSVSVVKRTPTITISKSGDVTVGTSYTISGTLSCSGSVNLYEDGSLIDTLTVTGGAFTETLTKSVTGSYSYYVVFDGDSVYEAVTSSTVTVTVSAIAPSYDDIVLTADDSILSYYDGDSTTLRAQLMDGSSTASVSGVTVEFFNGSTSMGTSQTDSNGVATKTYTSTGAGDVTLSAEADNGTLVSETYSIEDCLITRASVSDSDTFNVSLPNHFTFSSMITRESSSSSYCYPVLTNYQFGVLREKGSLSVRVGTGSPFADNNTSIVPLNTPTLMTYEYNNGVHTLTANNVTVTGTENTYSIGSFLRMTIQRYTVTDLKIKTL